MGNCPGGGKIVAYCYRGTTPKGSWGGPFGAPLVSLVRELEERGLLRALPCDASGVLQVNVPFCRALVECPILLDLLPSRLLSAYGARTLHFLGVDIGDFSSDWAERRRWVDDHVPSVKLDFCCADLTKDPLPLAGLTLAFHPGPLRTADDLSCWQQIVSTVIRAVPPGGVCVFALFHDYEKAALLNMCAFEGVSVDVFENPWYRAHPMTVTCFVPCTPSCGVPFLRHVVIIRA
eukprot:TRINITY_DN45929_c0_g1_i1.p2 TRINITY_DN45929_c0_g1~~TRINITY_DN45929_c0_g1_i1.p2  ORF type:complete len:234 (+),score=30.57 TRINITY_DN45929_c0_g1_i1:72-773(+)